MKGMYRMFAKTEIIKLLNSEENSKRKVPNQMAKSNMIKHIKRMDNNCHFPDLVQAFSNVENGGLNLVYSAKPLACMTFGSNSIIFTTMREQNTHNK